MDKLNIEQTETANKLLSLLCDNEEIDGTKMYSIFKSKDDAEYVCSILVRHGLLWILEAGNRIAILKRTDKTINAVSENLLGKLLSSQDASNERVKLEIELAKSNIEANKLNSAIAAKNNKNKLSNNIATWLNIAIGLINIGIIAWQLWKAE